MKYWQSIKKQTTGFRLLPKLHKNSLTNRGCELDKNAKKLKKFPLWINYRAYLLAKDSLANPKKLFYGSEALDIVLANKPRMVGNNFTPHNKYLGTTTISYFLKRWGWTNIRGTKHSTWHFAKDEEWLENLYQEIFQQTPENYEAKEVY